MHLETLPARIPTALDPFGLLQPKERTQLKQLVADGCPVPAKIDRKEWRNVLRVAKNPITTRPEPARYSRFSNRFDCDLCHTQSSAHWIVTAAPKSSDATVNSVLCNFCKERRERFSSFQFTAIQSGTRFCCFTDMDNTGQVMCSSCVPVGHHIIRSIAQY